MPTLTSSSCWHGCFRLCARKTPRLQRRRATPARRPGDRLRDSDSLRVHRCSSRVCWRRLRGTSTRARGHRAALTVRKPRLPLRDCFVRGLRRAVASRSTSCTDGGRPSQTARLSLARELPDPTRRGPSSATFPVRLGPVGPHRGPTDGGALQRHARRIRRSQPHTEGRGNACTGAAPQRRTSARGATVEGEAAALGMPTPSPPQRSAGGMVGSGRNRSAEFRPQGQRCCRTIAVINAANQRRGYPWRRRDAAQAADRQGMPELPRHGPRPCLGIHMQYLHGQGPDDRSGPAGSGTSLWPSALRSRSC